MHRDQVVQQAELLRQVLAALESQCKEALEPEGSNPTPASPRSMMLHASANSTIMASSKLPHPERERDSAVSPRPRQPQVRSPIQDSCEHDLRCLNATVRRLQISGWYFEELSRQQAKAKLKHAPVGSFLVRNSSDPRYIFSLTVKSSRGTTSVRIVYQKGNFILDCEDSLQQQMPRFDCVVKLVEFYIKLTETDKKNQSVCVWLEPSGRRDVPVKLSQPVLERVPSLKHACRLSIAKHTAEQQIHRLPLPTLLKDYLREYPYSH